MPRKKSSRKTNDKIDDFFDDYPEFDYNRQASSPREFYRMCDFFGWDKDRKGRYPPERTAAHEDFRHAMVGSFNDNFGTDVHSKIAWENICALLKIEPLPDSAKDMKELVKSTHVNLSDLLDGERSGAKVKIFDTESELATYTIGTGRFFPKEEAYAGGVLKFLLREITGKYQGHKGRQRSKKQKKGGKA